MKEYLIFATKFALLSLITLIITCFHATAVNASGTLAVTSVSPIKLTGIANNTYADGWKWVFHITLPSDENLVRMRFSDFTNGSQVIPANNIRLYSSQSVNSNSEATAIQISAADTYSDQININSALDLDPLTDGIQIDMNVDSKIPLGIIGTGYNTSYDITSEAPEVTIPDQTPDAEVFATTTQIVSGLCLSLDVPNGLQMRVAVSGGDVVYGTSTRSYPAFTVSSPADQTLATYGLDWYIDIGVFPTLQLNTYSLLTYDEAHDPLMVGSSTLVGRIKFDNVGNITYIESLNPNCPKVDAPAVEKPIISSSAPTDVTQVAGTQFSDPLATAWDTVDGDITSKLIYSNNIQIWEPGDYFVNVNVVNSRGYRADQFTQHLHLLPLTPEMIAKKELESTIVSIVAPIDAGIYKIGNNPGEYPQVAFDELFSVITEATNVRDNPASTVNEYTDAKSKLIDAILLFINKKII